VGAAVRCEQVFAGAVLGVAAGAKASAAEPDPVVLGPNAVDRVAVLGALRGPCQATR
jgi:hypothetical protein